MTDKNRKYFSYGNGIPGYRDEGDPMVNLYIGGKFQERGFLAVMHDMEWCSEKEFVKDMADNDEFYKDVESKTG